MPMVGEMNAIAHVSAAPTTGPKLDNRRVLAAIVDLLIVTAGALVVLVAGDSLSGDRQGALGVVILGWALYYYFALESGDGQTVGKKVMKLRVVCADGRPAGMREVAVRTVLRVVDGIGVYIVGLIVMLVTGERRQRLGDLAANTMVVDASAPAVAAPAPAAETVSEDEADPAPTITLPSRPDPPATLSDVTEDVEVEEPVAEVEEPLPSGVSRSLSGLAADVAAAHDADEDTSEDDEPVAVKSVETVSAMDLIMGAADEDAGKQSDDEAPATA